MRFSFFSFSCYGKDTLKKTVMIWRPAGLDPALPAFELALASGRLDKGDAEFVDVIHTNSGYLWEVGPGVKIFEL